MSVDGAVMASCVQGCGAGGGLTWRSRRRVEVVGSMTGGIPRAKGTLKEQ